MKFDDGVVFANFLHGLFEHDELAVDVETELLESLGDLDCVYRTEDSAGGACLGSDGEAYAFERFGGSFGIGLELCELVGTLALVLSKHFQRRFSGYYGLSEGNKVVAAVARLNFNHVVFVTEVVDVFLKNDFHKSLALKVVFISSGQLHRAGARDGGHALRPEPRDAGISARCR